MINQQIMSRVVAEIEYYGEQETCERWDVPLRTLQQYQKMAKVNPEFAALCAQQKVELESLWTQGASAFHFQTLQELTKRMPTLEHQEDIESFNAIVNAVKEVGALLIDWHLLTSIPGTAEKFSQRTIPAATAKKYADAYGAIANSLQVVGNLKLDLEATRAA